MAMPHEERLRKGREQKKHKRLIDSKYRERENDRVRKWASTHKEELKTYYKNYRLNKIQEYKTQVFDILGRVCVHCGYSNPRALQIDHIEGNAKEDKKLRPNAYSYYKKIVERNGVGYQILCANCNMIKSFSGKEHRGKFVIP